MASESAKAPRERRVLPRFAGCGLSAYVRPRGSFSRLSVEIIDFNRHGAAVHVHQPLNSEQVVYLTLKHGGTHLPRLIGVVHNCVTLETGFRCGIRFRPQSDLQFDSVMIEAQLAQLEGLLSDLENQGGE